MTKAQTAWAVLTGLLIIAAVILLTVPTAANPAVYGSICLGFGILGWMLLGGMIANDTKAVREKSGESA